MKRSRINAIIREADAFIRAHGYRLPPFAYWSPDEALLRKHQARGVWSARLGWDVTDFSKGDFDRVGLFLFTVRNGDAADLARGRGMLYAEKIMIVRNGQVTPMHRHVVKAEDIIVRGGGTLALRLFMSAADGAIDREAPVTVVTDGVERLLGPGDTLRLQPGESVTLIPGVWHSFWGEEQDVLVGEVSTVNDDETDNVFEEPVARFSGVEEDEPPLHLLVSDYGGSLGL